MKGANNSPTKRYSGITVYSIVLQCIFNARKCKLPIMVSQIHKTFKPRSLRSQVKLSRPKSPTDPTQEMLSTQGET